MNAPLTSSSNAQGDAKPKTLAPHPEGRLGEANEVKVTIKMHTTISPNYISTLGFGFKGSFLSTSANSKNSFKHKSATIAFTGDSIVKIPLVKAINPSNKAFASRVSPQEVAMAKH